MEIVLEFDSYSVAWPDPKSSTSPLSGEFLRGSQIEILFKYPAIILNSVNIYMQHINVTPKPPWISNGFSRMMAISSVLY